MSRLNKFIFIFALLLLAPKLGSAKTLEYDGQVWEVNPEIIHSTQSAMIRNNFDLKNLVEHAFRNTPLTIKAQVIDSETAAKIQEIGTLLNRPTVNAQLEIQGSWASVFIPHQNGQVVDINKLAQLLSAPFEKISLPVVVSEPQVKLGDLNNMGITELITRGESDFSGSSKNRIINVDVGSSKYNGLIIQPGEEFSFNKYLGDIDAAHGFKPEQVIKASGIEYEFGGGLCQVSTTMFRAAMQAGLPITQRRNHSFAVHYYSPQGTDATIYPGASDLKFVNDYTHPIIIRTYLDAPHVYFEIYGTRDDRQVVLHDPVQFDRKSDGSMKATWTREVIKNGQTSTYVAKSTYVSPNLYKKVEVAATPNPEAVANTQPAPQVNPQETPATPNT